jgi:hypothetical protein
MVQAKEREKEKKKGVHRSVTLSKKPMLKPAKKDVEEKRSVPAPTPTLRVYSQKVSMYQNSDGNVRKSFQIVESNGEKVIKTEGISNKKNATKFHIMRTIQKHHGMNQQYFVITEKDIMHLLKEGNRLGDYAKMMPASTLKEKKAKEAKAKKTVLAKQVLKKGKKEGEVKRARKKV